MKIKSYNLFLESCIDEDTIPVIRKVILDRLDGEIIDGLELTEYDKSVVFGSLTTNAAPRAPRSRETPMNHFRLIKSNHYLYGQVMMLIIRFKSDKIISYIEVIREDINELDLQSLLKREDQFTWSLTIHGGF
jgi:hypothetical protein